VRDGLAEDDSFPQLETDAEIARYAMDASLVFRTTEEGSECHITVFERSSITRSSRN
jgi:hypothetical protein